MSLIARLLHERLERNRRLIERHRQWPGVIAGKTASELIRELEEENRECERQLAELKQAA